MMMSPGFSKSSISSYGRRDSTGSHSSSTAISDPFADTSDSSSKPQGSMSRLIKERIISSGYSKSSISSEGRRDSSDSNSSETVPMSCPPANVKPHGAMSRRIKEMKGRMTIKTPRSSVQMGSPGASTSKLSHP